MFLRTPLVSVDLDVRDERCWHRCTGVPAGVRGDGQSDEMKLESKSDSFEQGQCDKFIVCLCVFLSLCLIKMYSGPKTYLYLSVNLSMSLH